jgi:hypothetical protein
MTTANSVTADVNDDDIGMTDGNDNIADNDDDGNNDDTDNNDMLVTLLLLLLLLLLWML